MMRMRISTLFLTNIENIFFILTKNAFFDCSLDLFLILLPKIKRFCKILDDILGVDVGMLCHLGLLLIVLIFFRA